MLQPHKRKTKLETGRLSVAILNMATNLTPNSSTNYEDAQSKPEDASSHPLKCLEEMEKGVVHGVVGSVSPMTKAKSGKEYFHAFLTDGSDKLRVVGFGKSQRNLLKDFEEKGDPVALEDCRVKRSRYSDDLEIMLKPETTLVVSPKRVKVDPQMFTSNKPVIELKEVIKRPRFDHVSFNAKVVRVDSEAVVADGLKVQNIVVADHTKAVKVAIWEADIGSVQKHKSYFFENFVVNIFKSEKFLQWPKTGATVTEIDNIGDVEQDDVPGLESVNGAEVAGVLNLDCSTVCIACKSRVDKKNQRMGICCKCGMTQSLERCATQMRARLLLTVPGGEYITVRAYGKQLEKIADTADVTEETLITSQPFNLTHDHNMVNTVSR